MYEQEIKDIKTLGLGIEQSMFSEAIQMIEKDEYMKGSESIIFNACDLSLVMELLQKKNQEVAALKGYIETQLEKKRKDILKSLDVVIGQIEKAQEAQA